MNGLIEFVKTLGPSRIAAMDAVTAIPIGFFAFVIMRFSQPTMAPLFTLVETASGRLTKLAEARGYAGRLVLLPEPGLAADDCRNELADVGIRRERGAIEARINEAVARYLGSNRKSFSFSDLETVQ